MARSEYDAEASWNNALLTTLYRAGKVHMLMDEVAEGRAAGYGNFNNVSYQRGFVLNSQTYLYFIKVSLVESPGGFGLLLCCAWVCSWRLGWKMDEAWESQYSGRLHVAW